MYVRILECVTSFHWRITNASNRVGTTDVAAAASRDGGQVARHYATREMQLKRARVRRDADKRFAEPRPRCQRLQVSLGVREDGVDESDGPSHGMPRASRPRGWSASLEACRRPCASTSPQSRGVLRYWRKIGYVRAAGGPGGGAFPRIHSRVSVTVASHSTGRRDSKSASVSESLSSEPEPLSTSHLL